MTTHVVDTNVVLVANRMHDDVSPECVLACVGHLQSIMKSGRVAIDEGYEILREYRNKTQPREGKGAGDVFLKWLLQNQGNPARCDRIPLSPHPRRGFEAFPEDARLVAFDPPDRKFVAVAAAHPERPAISQAADSKWLGWASALAEHGVVVDFLCPSDIRSFRKGFNDQKRRGKTRGR